MKLRLSLILALAAAGWLLGACAEHRVPPAERPEGHLAVAGFTNPRFDWQLLAGYIPEEGRGVDKEVLADLDEAMVMVLDGHGVADYVSPRGTRQCQEIVTFETLGGKKRPALDYWVDVGRCMKVDYLLVPQVLSWRERVGDELAAEIPASVTLDLYLIDVNDPTRIARKHFDETQKSLSEDLGNAEKFFERDGEWVTATYLAVEGLDQMLYELGL